MCALHMVHVGLLLSCSCMLCRLQRPAGWSFKFTFTLSFSASSTACNETVTCRGKSQPSTEQSGVVASTGTGPELQVLLLPACGRSTRLDSSMGLCLPPARSNSGKGTFAFQGALCWNNLPSSIRSISVPRQFRAAAVPFLL